MSAPAIVRPAGSKWRATLRRWFRPPRRLQFTREGRYFVGITIGIGFAAMYGGNNLLYLLLGMMLSLIIASGVLSEMSLRGLEVQRSPPGRLHATRPFLMGISLRNGKKRFPSFSIEVEDLVDDKPLDKKCYFLKIPSGRQQQTSYRHVAPRRGRTTFSGFRLSTKFPFALFRKSRLVEAPTEVIVFPAVHPLALGPPPLRGYVGDELSGRRGRRGEFDGLRELRDGDDPRDIHWRSSARRGRAMVREHEDEATRRVTLFIDNALPDGAACTDKAALDALERAISLVASLAAHYLERGFSVRLVGRGSSAPWATNPSNLVTLLRYLALLPTVTDGEPFASTPDPQVETLYVARRGAPHPAAGFAQVLEA